MSWATTRQRPRDPARDNHRSLVTVRRVTDRSGSKFTQETPLRLVTRRTTLRERQALGPQHGTPSGNDSTGAAPQCFPARLPPTPWSHRGPKGLCFWCFLGLTSGTEKAGTGHTLWTKTPLPLSALSLEMPLAKVLGKATNPVTSVSCGWATVGIDTSHKHHIRRRLDPQCELRAAVEIVVVPGCFPQNNYVQAIVCQET